MSYNEYLNPRLFEPGTEVAAPKKFPFQGEVREQQMWSPQDEVEFERADEVRGGRLEVRAPTRALPGILQSRAIKSQHETGTSMGAYAPGYRAQHERSALGFDDHPVYGHVVNSATERDRGEHYGSARFTMKPSVRDRTTVIENDSLVEAPEAPAPMRDVESGRSLLPRSSPPGSHFGDMDYIEAQIHTHDGDPFSRVPLSDVASLDFDRASGARTLHDYGELGQQFQDAGVSTWHNVEHETYQAPLPYSNEELQRQDFRAAGTPAWNPDGQEWRRQSSALGTSNLSKGLGVLGDENVGRFVRPVHQTQLADDIPPTSDPHWPEKLRRR